MYLNWGGLGVLKHFKNDVANCYLLLSINEKNTKYKVLSSRALSNLCCRMQNRSQIFIFQFNYMVDFGITLNVNIHKGKSKITDDIVSIELELISMDF